MLNRTKLDPIPKGQIKETFCITKMRVRYCHFILFKKFVEEDPPFLGYYKLVGYCASGKN